MTKKKLKYTKKYFLIILILSLGLFSFANAAINQELNYQGKLVNSVGVAVPDGTYNMRYKLYTVSSGGTAIWSEDRINTDKVQVTKGLFSVMLGSVASLSSINFNQTLYLGVEIGGTGTTPTWDGEMSPRKKLGSVASAFNSDKLDNLDSTDFAQLASNNTFTGSNTFASTTISNINATNLYITASSTLGSTTISNLTVSVVNGISAIFGTIFATTGTFNNLTASSTLTLSATPSALLSTDATGKVVATSSVSSSLIGLQNGYTFRGSTSNGAEATSTIFISNTGNVGINTKIPGYLLTVASTTSDAGIIMGFGNTSISGGLQVITNGNLDWGFNAFNSRSLVFQTNQLERMRINASGNIGIGTATPTQQLELTGNLQLPNTVDASTGVIYKNGARFLHNYSFSSSNGQNTFIGTNAGNFTMGSSTSALYGSYNTAIGTNVLLLNTTGYSNTGIGVGSLISNTTGYLNNTLGTNAMRLNTSGYNNVALGSSALYNNLTGYNNTAVGLQALYSNTDGFANVANGTNALYSNTTGNYNVANGNAALYNNATGSNNVAVGYQALWNNLTGVGNVANGFVSLYSNTTGNYNVANGQSSLRFNTTGSYNSSYGINNSYNNTTGSYNVAMGASALFSNTAGSYNTIIGQTSGYELDTPTGTGNNTFIGSNTGRGIVGGINNTILGANVTGLASTTSNNIIIADGAGNRRINVDANGNVGIGTTTPFSLLQVNGNFALEGISRYLNFGVLSSTGVGSTGYGFRDNGGVMEYKNNAGSWASFASGNGSMSGTPNYLPLYTSSNSLGNSAIYQSGSNIGIGTTNLLARFDVRGAGANAGIFLGNTDWNLGTVGSGLRIEQGASTGDTFTRFQAFTAGGSGAGNIVLNVAGNVGIGTTTPDQKFTVDNGYLKTNIFSGIGGLQIAERGGNPQLMVMVNSATPGATTLANNWGNSSNPGIVVGTTRTDGTAFQVGTGITKGIDGLPSSNGTTAFYVGGNGNVGIGTTSPLVQLDVGGLFSPVANGGINFPTALFSASSSGTTGINVSNFGTMNNSEGRIVVSAASSSVPSSRDYIALSMGNDTNTSTLFGYARSGLASLFTAAGTGGSSGRTLAIGTFNANDLFFGTANVERARITSTGNFGIGTTTPTSKLEVAGVPLSSTPGFKISNSGTGQTLDMGLWYGGATTNGWINANGGPLLLQPGGGNVGIGTTSPTSLLNVAGNALFQGANSVYQNGAYSTLDTRAAGGTGTTGAALSLLASGNSSYNNYLAAYMNVGNSGAWWAEGLNSDKAFGLDNGDNNDYQWIYNTTVTPVSYMTIKSNGNIGIGTTSPSTTLTVNGDISIPILNGAKGIRLGTTAPHYTAYLTTVFGSGGEYGAEFISNTTVSTKALGFRYNNTTDVGSIVINNTSTSYNTTSDRRTKENIATTTQGISELMQLPVRSFSFISDNNHATTTGFIAQELYKVFPWAVTTNGDDGIVSLGASTTPWSVDYGRVTPLLVKAIQDIANITSTFKENLIKWLADSSNGIQKLFANEVHTKKICVDDDQGNSTCINRAQLDSILNNSGTNSTFVPATQTITPTAPATSTTTQETTTTASTTSQTTDTSIQTSTSTSETTTTSPATTEPAPADTSSQTTTPTTDTTTQ